MPELDNTQEPRTIAFCPDCGQKAVGNAFCVACGSRLRDRTLGVPAQAGATEAAPAPPPGAAAPRVGAQPDNPFALPAPRPEENVAAYWYGTAPAWPAAAQASVSQPAMLQPATRQSAFPQPAVRQPSVAQPHRPGPASPPILLPHGWIPATFLQRVGARIVDALVVLVLCIAGWALLATVVNAGDSNVSLGAGLALLAAFLLLPSVVTIAYRVLSDFGSGRSPGRAALGIRLVRLPMQPTDEPIPPDSVEARVGIGTAIGRLFVSGLGDSLFWLSSLSVLWHPQRRSWGDRATDTAVVVDRDGERQSALLPVLVSAVLVGVVGLGGATLSRGSTPVQEAAYGSSTNYSDSPSTYGTGDSSGSGSSTPDYSSAPSDVPISTGADDTDTWVAQLASVPIGNTAQLEAQYRSIAATIPDVRVVSSSSFASLTPGYWMLYYPGDFSSGTSAVGYCTEQGRSIPDDCFGRYLSHDAGDAKLLCYGTPTAASEEICARHYRP